MGLDGGYGVHKYFAERAMQRILRIADLGVQLFLGSVGGIVELRHDPFFKSAAAVVR